MIDASAIAAALRAHPGVVRLHPGRFGTASTFTAEGRVWGVRVAPDFIDLHIVIRPEFPMIELAQALTRMVQQIIRETVVDYAGQVRVHIEDLLVDDATTLATMRAAPPNTVMPTPLSNRSTPAAPGRKQ